MSDVVVASQCIHPVCNRKGDRRGMCGTYARVHVKGGSLVRPRDFDTPERRYCAICKEYRPIESFSANRKGKFDSSCRPCRAVYWFQLRMKREYGLTPSDYEDLVSGGCRGCFTKANLVVDHDHQTGAVRGALCDPCNQALGRVKDDPDVLRRLADYLELP